MDDVLGLRPFVPARDFDRSTAFYEALGFLVTHKDASVAVLKLGDFSFVLQNFYVEEHAANCMVQLLLRDAGAWWAARDLPALAAAFGARAPIPPAMQPWGLKVGYLFDPSGVLWHIAEAPGAVR